MLWILPGWRAIRQSRYQANMKKILMRVGIPGDLNALETVENRCFSELRRGSRASLRRSLCRPTQQVWMAWADGGSRAAGAMTLHWRAGSVRIYSLAVMPDFRGQGVGRRLMNKALSEATHQGVRYLSLEADRRDRRLVAWYGRFGFEVVQILADYYSPGRDAVRMRRPLPPAHRNRNRKAA